MNLDQIVFKLSNNSPESPIKNVSPLSSYFAALAGIYVTGGNEDSSFVPKYQESKAIYAHVNGQIPIFICSNIKEAQDYQKRLEEYNQTVKFIRVLTSFDLQDLNPLLIVQDLVTSFLNLKDTIRANEPKVFKKFVQNTELSQLCSDQLSDFEIKLLTSFLQKINPSFDLAILENLEKQARLNDRFNDKAKYFELIKNNPDIDLPLHTKTQIITVQDLENCPDFASLQKLIPKANSKSLVIKSSKDAGGECVILVSEKNFIDKKAELFRELRSKNRPNNPNFKLLVQEMVMVTKNSDLPSSIGLNCVIDPSGQVKINAIAGQIYENPEKTEYLSSVWDKKIEDRIVAKIGLAKIQNLCDLFAKAGYRGSIGFDAMLDELGNYKFIYDCNPRLSAVMSILATCQFLEKQGISIQNISSMGYRGRFKITEENIKKLNEQNILLKKPTRKSLQINSQKGVLLLPNLAGGDNSYDIIFVNMNEDETQKTLIILSEFAKMAENNSHLSQLPVNSQNALTFY